ncbi:MAG: hypothetical protein M4D85_05440 [Actinomycetota bacterium]|nr:hypothetical protein [Actinomycetota bacterium]
MTDPYELPETESLAPTPWWQQRSVVRGAVGVLGAGGILVALAGASAAVVLVSGGGGEDTLRDAAPEVILTPSASPTLEPTPVPKLSEATTPSPEATTPSPVATTSPAAPTTTAAATPSRSPTPVRTTAAPVAPAAGQPSPTKSAATTPSPTGTAPGEVYITFINQTTQEMRFSADTLDAGSKLVAVVAAPGTQKRIVFHPNPEHATAVAGNWTQNPDCSMADAPGLPAPGSYTIIQRYQAGAGPGPTACAGHRQMEMVSPDADGMMRP